MRLHVCGDRVGRTKALGLSAGLASSESPGELIERSGDFGGDPDAVAFTGRQYWLLVFAK